ncbi:hypothetical protein SNEBB_004037 [Seison nebaliae]|nr:hypothetical protein SNEBB_004037 [Seison nebaliae]
MNNVFLLLLYCLIFCCDINSMKRSEDFFKKKFKDFDDNVNAYQNQEHIIERRNIYDRFGRNDPDDLLRGFFPIWPLYLFAMGIGALFVSLLGFCCYAAGIVSPQFDEDNEELPNLPLSLINEKNPTASWVQQQQLFQQQQFNNTNIQQQQQQQQQFINNNNIQQQQFNNVQEQYPISASIPLPMEEMNSQVNIMNADNNGQVETNLVENNYSYIPTYRRNMQSRKAREEEEVYV